MSKYTWKGFALTSLIVISLILLSSPALSAPILGGQLYSLGGTVEVELLVSDAAWESDLWLYEPLPAQYLSTNRDPVGTVVDLGTFAEGVELIFGVYVHERQPKSYSPFPTFKMGPKSRNPDCKYHATVEFLAPGVANVGFEDQWGGGDKDYNDIVFQFRGAIAQGPGHPGSPIPEPATLILLGVGLTGIAIRRRRNY